MFNIIFPVIIFVSLAVIVFILGKHLPEFIDIKKNSDSESKTSKKNLVKKVLAGAWVVLRNSGIWLMEQVIKKIKNFLTLIQSWIIDTKEKRSSAKVDQLEREAIISEPEGKEDFLRKIARKEDKVVERKELGEEEQLVKETFEIHEGKNPGFFSKLKNSLKEKVLEKKKKKINQVFQDIDEDNEQFSDGIIKIQEKKPQKKFAGKGLINEVVEIRKTDSSKMNIDDEIGIDRHILEKKLISKIARNPKDREVYRQLGELYLKMKNFSDAENCYKQILKIATRDVDAKRKIERIKLLKRSSKR